MANPTPRDWTGTRLGFLTVIGRGPRNQWKMNGGHSVWIAACECGRRRYITAGDLRKGRGVHCGHMQCPYRKPKTRHKFNAMRKQVWKLTPEEAKEIANQPCHICGATPAGGVDLKNKLLSFTTSNTVGLCRRCRLFKDSHSLEELMRFLRDAVKNLFNIELP